jgi:hypothetical protein
VAASLRLHPLVLPGTLPSTGSPEMLNVSLAVGWREMTPPWAQPGVRGKVAGPAGEGLASHVSGGKNLIFNFHLPPAFQHWLQSR